MPPPPSPPLTSDPVEWYPTRVLRKRRPDDRDDGDGDGQQKETTTAAPFALVVLNQPLRDVPTLKRLWDNSSWRLAADGGANRLLDVILSHQKGAGPPKTRKRPRREDVQGPHDQDRREEEKEEVVNGGSDEACRNLMEINKLDIIIGDLDSLSSEARTYFTNPANNPNTSKTTKIIHDSDQESTDFGKAVTYIRTNTSSPTTVLTRTGPFASSSSSPSPLDIVVLGGLGGRVDQGLSQLHHLYLFQKDPDYQQGRMFLVSGESLTFLLKAGKTHRIHVREPGSWDDGDMLFDKYVGIIPIREPSVITTNGLEWDVTDWETEFGGRMSTSNHVLPETKVVEVKTTKDVLFTIALKKSE